MNHTAYSSAKPTNHSAEWEHGKEDGWNCQGTPVVTDLRDFGIRHSNQSLRYPECILLARLSKCHNSSISIRMDRNFFE